MEKYLRSFQSSPTVKRADGDWTCAHSRLWCFVFVCFFCLFFSLQRCQSCRWRLKSPDSRWRRSLVSTSTGVSVWPGALREPRRAKKRISGLLVSVKQTLSNKVFISSYISQSCCWGGFYFHLAISPELVMIWCFSVLQWLQLSWITVLQFTHRGKYLTLVGRNGGMRLLEGSLKKRNGTLNLSIHENAFHWIQYISNHPYESNWNKNRFEIYCCAAIINLSREHRHIPRRSLKSFIRRSHFTFEYFKAFCLLIPT